MNLVDVLHASGCGVISSTVEGKLELRLQFSDMESAVINKIASVIYVFVPLTASVSSGSPQGFPPEQAALSGPLPLPSPPLM